MTLKTVTFLFDSCQVKWQYLGRGLVNGRSYPSTYNVFVHFGTVHRVYKTSTAPNISNSQRFAKDALPNKKEV